MDLRREDVDCIELIWEKEEVECRCAVMKFWPLNSGAEGWKVFE